MKTPEPPLDLQQCALAVKTCACFQFRKASRAVTQHFDEILQPTGLRSTQLVILLAVALNDNVSPAGLARQLVMDRSTLVRNLKPLEKRDLVVSQPGKDRRTRSVVLTPTGRGELALAMPYWEKAQREFLQNLGSSWEKLQGELATAGRASQRRIAS